ncbi:MAG: rubredoxin-like domain-containing protein [Bacilli bacterium]
MSLYKCSVCNYIEELDELTQPCLKCGALPASRKQLDEAQTELIYNSDRTNDINMEIISLCAQIIDLCDEGVDIALDPTCIKGFIQTNDRAWEIKQLLKAEIESHIGKGKW